MHFSHESWGKKPGDWLLYYYDLDEVYTFAVKGLQGSKRKSRNEENRGRRRTRKKGIREPRRHDEGFRWRRSLERNLERHTYKLVGLSPSHAVWYSCWMSLSFLTHDSLIKGQKILISLLSACISWSFPSNFFTTPESFSIFFLLILVTLRISVLLRLWLCKESEMQANGDDDERKGKGQEKKRSISWHRLLLRVFSLLLHSFVFFGRRWCVSWKRLDSVLRPFWSNDSSLWSWGVFWETFPSVCLPPSKVINIHRLNCKSFYSRPQLKRNSWLWSLGLKSRTQSKSVETHNEKDSSLRLLDNLWVQRHDSFLPHKFVWLFHSQDTCLVKEQSRDYHL